MKKLKATIILILFTIIGLISSLSQQVPVFRILGNTPQYNIALNNSNNIEEADFSSETSPAPKDIVSIKGWASSPSTSYVTTPTSAVTSSSAIELTLNNFNPSNGQIRGATSSNTTETRFMAYNTQPLPGYLKRITLKISSGQLDGSSAERNLLLIGNNSFANTLVGGTRADQTENNVSFLTWTVDLLEKVTFFKIYNLFTIGSTYAGDADALTIEYVDYEASQTFKTVNMIYERAFFNDTGHASLGKASNGLTGKLYNAGGTQITSITRILVVFSYSQPSGGEIVLTTGFTEQPTGNPLSLVSGVEVIVSGDPYFMMIRNLGLTTVFIESLTIYYSCIPNENPVTSSSEISSSSSSSSSSLPSQVFYDDGETYEGYYSGISETIYGDDLHLALYQLLLQTHVRFTSYTSLRDHFYQTDGDPNNPNNLLLYYSGESREFLGSFVSGYENDNRNINREHVWSQSKFATSTTVPGPYADVHHVRPADVNTNSSRGNKDFGFQLGPQAVVGVPDMYADSNTATVYPNALYRGDVARNLFYVAVRYGIFSPFNLTFADTTVGNGTQIGIIYYLLLWNEQYPPSNVEIRRNEAASVIQGNRNPFIDYPGMACKIWANYNLRTQQACSA
jgi:endonuclease I